FAVISSLYPGLCLWRRPRRSAPSLPLFPRPLRPAFWRRRSPCRQSPSLHPLPDERRSRCDFCPWLFSYVVQRPELGLTWVSLLEPCCCCWAFSRACLVAS